jgi:uncharacterized membrane protein YGL010W
MVDIVKEAAFYLVLAFGLGVLISVVLVVWDWTLTKLTIAFGVNRDIVQFMYDKRRKKKSVYKPKINRDKEAK